jgi:hypothetical protein
MLQIGEIEHIDSAGTPKTGSESDTNAKFFYLSGHIVVKNFRDKIKQKKTQIS